jgi:hypothetical protein
MHNGENKEGRYNCTFENTIPDIYSSITNKMQCNTSVFIAINALHISGGSSAHHQELKTVYTAPLFVEFFCFLPLSWVSWNWFACAVGVPTAHANQSQLTHDSGKKQKKLDKYRCCVYSFELLMMARGTA